MGVKRRDSGVCLLRFDKLFDLGQDLPDLSMPQFADMLSWV